MPRSSSHVPSRLRHLLLASTWTIPSVALSIVAATLAWFAYDEYLQTIEQEYRFLEAHVRIAEGQLSGLLRNVKQALKQIAEEQPSLPAAGLAAYEATLAARNREIPEIRTLAVVNADGRVGMSVNPVLHGFDASARDYFTAHRDRRVAPNFYITRPFKSSFGDYSIAFSVPIRDEHQRFLGVVVAGVDYTYFESVLKQIKPEGDNSVAVIFNQDGDILYRLPDPEKSVGINLAGAEPFQAYKRSGRDMMRTIGVAQIGGIKRIYVYRSIPNTSLGVVVARPLDQVLAPWRRQLALRALIFAFATAVTLYLAWIAHRRQGEVLRTKEFSDQLIATANVMVVGLDAAGRVIIFNAAAEQVSGYGSAEMLGRDWFESAMPRARYPQTWEAFRAYHEAGDIPRSFEVPMLTKSGAERLVAWQNSAIRKHGKTIATISFGIDVTERQHVERARRKEEVSRRLVAAQEEERSRLAFELHDRTNPNLCALMINCQILKDTMPAPAPQAYEHVLEDTYALLEDTAAAIRAISMDVRPPLLDYAGFWPALEGYASRFSQRTGIAVHAGKDELAERLAPEVETNLFRIAQEALANCARHSTATTIRIEIKRNGDAIQFVIADDGAGFNEQSELEQAAPGHGLASMRQRAEFIGGKFSLETAPGKGTRIAVEFASAVALA